MLGEKGIVSFSPELGINTPDSNSFYPNSEYLINNILPQNIPAALYAIQKTGYMIKIIPLKTSYIDCKLISSMSHKFLEKDKDELDEEEICRNDYYQYTASLAVMNNGLSNFVGNLELNLKIFDNPMYNLTVSLKKDSKKLFYYDEKQINSNFSLPNQTLDNFTNFKKDFQIYLSEIDVDNYAVLNIRFYVNQSQLSKILESNSIVPLKALELEAKTSSNNNILKYNYAKFPLDYTHFTFFNTTLSDKEHKDYYQYSNSILVNNILIGTIIGLLFILGLTAYKMCKRPRTNHSAQFDSQDVTRADITVMGNEISPGEYTRVAQLRAADF